MECLGKLKEAINAFPNEDFKEFLKLGLDSNYTKRLNEDEIIKNFENMIKKASLGQNKKDLNDRLMI